MKKPAPGTIVEVKWRDTSGWMGWCEYTPGKLKPNRSVGYVLKSPKDRLTITQSIAPKGNVSYDGVLEICLENVVSWKPCLRK